MNFKIVHDLKKNVRGFKKCSQNQKKFIISKVFKNSTNAHEFKKVMISNNVQGFPKILMNSKNAFDKKNSRFQKKKN